MELHQPIKPYHTDHSIVYSCQYHVIFCPKYRRKVLSEAIAIRLKELILNKQQEYRYFVIEMEVIPDHAHLLLDVDPLPYNPEESYLPSPDGVFWSSGRRKCHHYSSLHRCLHEDAALNAADFLGPKHPVQHPH
ncbi:MAG: IS200/IS605 family transposase [Chloroflexaceae bacterium]|nr:IS200/IS605 family transposase [Chloroflexaceae bacterium]